MTAKRKKARNFDDGFRLRAKSYEDPIFNLDASVRDPACAVRVYLGWVHQHGYGASKAGDGQLTVDGQPLARISYNGRMWRPGPWRSNAVPTREPTMDDWNAAKDPAAWRKCLAGGGR